MTDATTSDVNVVPPSSPVTPCSPSASVNSSTSLGKRRHEQSSERESQPTARPSSPLPAAAAAHPSTPATPTPIRPHLNLDTIDTTLTNIPGPTFTHPTEPPSPVPTEIATDLPVAELTPEEHLENLQAAGIKVRDYAYHEPLPNALKAPEVFDPVPPLIAADWHMRNPSKNYGLLTPKALFRLIKIGWLTLADVARHFSPVEFATLREYNDRPDEQRYPFVVPAHDAMPSPEQRVRMRRRAGLAIHWDDFPDSLFFGYDPDAGSDDDHDDKVPSPPPRVAVAVAGGGAPTSTAAEAEAEEAPSRRTVPEPEPELEPAEPKAKRRKVKSTAKPRRGRAKPLRREFSRPEV